MLVDRAPVAVRLSQAQSRSRSSFKCVEGVWRNSLAEAGDAAGELL